MDQATMAPPQVAITPQQEIAQFQSEIRTITDILSALEIQNRKIDEGSQALNDGLTRIDTSPTADPLKGAAAMATAESQISALAATKSRNEEAIASNRAALSQLQERLEFAQYRQAMASCKAELEALTGSAEWGQMNQLLKRNFTQVLAIRDKHSKIMAYRQQHCSGRPAVFVSASTSAPCYQLSEDLVDSPMTSRLAITDVPL